MNLLFFLQNRRQTLLWSAQSETLPRAAIFARASNAKRFDRAGKLAWADANMLLNSATLSTQNVTTVTGRSYTLSFYGNGSVALSGGGTGTLAGTDADHRASMAFTPTDSTVVLTVSGAVLKAQLEPTSYDSPHAYHDTTSQPYYGPRFDYDPVTHEAKGLRIEEQRTNLCYPSVPDDTYTRQRVTIVPVFEGSPDGIGHIKIVDTTDEVASHDLVLTQGSYTAGNDYTISIFAQGDEQFVLQLRFSLSLNTEGAYGNFNLNTGEVVKSSNVDAVIQNIGNGWYRCSITTTANASSSTSLGAISLTNNNLSAVYKPSYTGTGTGLYVFGAQFEAGSFATSYIPTSTATSTRAAENLFTTNIPWFNATQGTMALEFIPVSRRDSTFSRYASFNDNTTSNEISLSSSGPTHRHDANVRTEGVMVVDFASASDADIVAGINKTALRYKENDVALASLGGYLHTDSSVALPTAISRLSLGMRNDSTSSVRANVWLRTFQYWPRALSAEELQQVTQ